MTKGLLAGKKVALKDNISVKDVPMLVGTDFFKDFVPVSWPVMANPLASRWRLTEKL